MTRRGWGGVSDDSTVTSVTRLNVAGYRVAVRRGRPCPHPGPPVVVVHGMAVSSRYLVPALKRLELFRSVMAPDLPGAGHSDYRGPPLSTRQYAEVLAALVTDLTGPATVVGHSAGCQVAAELAVLHPGLVRRLVVASPMIAREPWNPLIVALRWLVMVSREPVGLLPVLVRDAVKAGPRKVWRDFRDMLRYRLEDTVRHVRCPVRVIRGSEDPLVPAVWARSLAAAAGRGSYVEIPGVHALPYDAPDAFAAAVLRTD